MIVARISLAQIEAALEHGIDIPGRRVFLHGDIEGATIGRAIRGLYLLADMKPEPIELFVSSYGGDLDEAFALHDVTRTVRVPIHTVALGKCQSASPLLVACGHPGQRWVSENCQFMLHDMSLDVPEGNPSYVVGHAQAAKAQMALLAQLLGKYTKKGAAHWARMFAGKTDRFFTASEAKAWGLVDHVWSEKG